jgi:hypothetical protein
MKMNNEKKVAFHNRIKDPFTIVDNRLARLKSLSYEAKGLYLTLKTFGGIIYPSIKYLTDLGGGIGKNRLYKILDELLENKLIIRRQIRGKKGYLGRTEYMLLALDDDFDEIYKEFTGKEPENPQTPVNTKSYPCPQNRDTDNRDTDFGTQRRIIDKEDLFNEKEPHTQKEGEGVCENEIKKQIKKIKEIKLYQNSEAEVLKNLITQYGEEVLKAVAYIEDVNKKITVRNPEGLLIATLRNKLYSEIQENNKNNNINADVEKLNMQYRGFKVYENEKIKEILNIGGRIAFYTDNCLRELKYTPAKSYEEFKIILKKINSS